MKDFFTYVALFAAGLALIWLLRFLYVSADKRRTDALYLSRLKKQKTEDGRITFVRCPLCNTPLAAGEDLHSQIFRPMTTADQRMHILGCPHCYPRMQAGIKRACPVCHKPVETDSYLVARLFNKTKDNKKHVIVTGCKGCCSPK